MPVQVHIVYCGSWGYRSKADAVCDAVKNAFHDEKVEFTKEATPSRTSWLEVSVNGQLVHSKKEWYGRSWYAREAAEDLWFSSSGVGQDSIADCTKTFRLFMLHCVEETSSVDHDSDCWFCVIGEVFVLYIGDATVVSGCCHRQSPMQSNVKQVPSSYRSSTVARGSNTIPIPICKMFMGWYFRNKPIDWFRACLWFFCDSPFCASVWGKTHTVVATIFTLRV